MTPFEVACMEARDAIKTVPTTRSGQPRCQAVFKEPQEWTQYSRRIGYVGNGVFLQCFHRAVVGDFCGIHNPARKGGKP